MGAAEDPFHAPRAEYTLDASSSAGPSATQLVQKKLADMETEIALGLQAHFARRPPDGRRQVAPRMISIVKRNNDRYGHRA